MPDSNAPEGRTGTGDAAGDPPLVPNHTLVSLIARGSYGEVWLARSELGQMRAVKLVFRSRFTNSKPYEREFAGIRRFEPISREHEGFVDILQIGINEAEGFFFYVMELADDERQNAEVRMQNGRNGQSTNPDSAFCTQPSALSPNCDLRTPISQLPASNSGLPAYFATTLLSEIHRLGHLPVDRVLDLRIRLASALDFLHQKGLVHRDIKPSNIIFVNGQPKLADVGLVADLGDPRSFVGTEGYIPPEGPGTAQADIYSLGKVLYEAATGKDRHEFPQVGSAIESLGSEQGADLPSDSQADPPRERGQTLLEINEVLLKCCARSTKHRYQSAAAMLADLRRLEGGTSLRRRRQHRSRLHLAATSLVVMALLIVGGGAALETVRSMRAKPTLLLHCPFDTRKLPKSLWVSGRLDGGDLSTRARNATIEPGAGQLVLRAEAEASTDGVSVSVDEWVDLQRDLRALRPCSLILEISGDAQGGICAASISDGSSPKPVDVGIALWLMDCMQGSPRLQANKMAPTRIRIDFPSNVDAAVVYPSADHLEQFDLVDLHALETWRLRFRCLAGTSRGFEYGHAELRIAAFSIYSNPGGPSHVLTVVDKLSGRGIPDALVALEDGSVIARSAQKGGVLLTNVMGHEMVFSKAKYETSRVRFASTPAGASSALSVPLEKAISEIGDIVADILYGDLPIASIGFRGDQLWALASSDEIGSQFLKVDPASRSISTDWCGPWIPRLNSFVKVNERLFGLTHWQGALSEIASGSASTLHTLYLPGLPTTEMDWSWSCTFDGELCWFIETDFPRGRFFLHGLNLESGVIECSVQSTDPSIQGLAWDGQKFWLSSKRGVVCAVDREAAIRTKSVRLAQGRQFSGQYTSLAFGNGYLWGLDPIRKRIYQIRTEE